MAKRPWTEQNAQHKGLLLRSRYPNHSMYGVFTRIYPLTTQMQVSKQNTEQLGKEPVIFRVIPQKKQ